MSGIFISYRREDTAGHAGRLYDRLRERFGTASVFMDVSGIEAGTDFVQAIERAVGSCDVLLVVMGRTWLSCADAGGRHRLEDADDFVRLEIATALHREVRLIPVLIDGATMPSAEALPDELKPLVRRQAVELRNSRWDVDVQGLIATLEATVSGSLEGMQRVTAKRQNGPLSKARRWVKGLSLKVIGASAAVFLALGLFLAYYFLLPPAELVVTLDLPNESIRQFVPLPDGRLASASTTGTIKVWNLSTLEAEATLDHRRDVKGLVPLPSEQIVSVDENDGAVSLWDLRTGKVERTLEKSESQLGDDVIPLGEERFAVGTRAGINIWNVVTGGIEKRLKLGEEYPYDNWVPLITKLRLLHDGRLATGDHLGTVRIWNLINGQPEVIVNKGKGERGAAGDDGVTGLTELKDGRLAFSTFSRNEVTIWNPTSGKKEKVLPTTDTARGLATLKDGRLAVLEGKNLITLWNPTTGKKDASFHVGPMPDNYYALALTPLPDGRLVIDAGDAIQLWKLR